MGVPALNLRMFIRKKPNKSGIISVQVIDKSSGKYRLVKTIGSSREENEVEKLFQAAQRYIDSYSGQTVLNFDIREEERLTELFFKGIKEVRLLGPELLLGKLFDEIGYNKIKDTLFRHLVITRLVNPGSKLKTTDYLYKHQGLSIDVERVYRYLDKLHSKQKEIIEQISYEHTLKLFDNQLNFVFYDVTTLYFEAEQEDDLRKMGFSKEGKHQNPQILLGLLVSVDGYPLAYDIYEGNKYEGDTLLPVIEGFKTKYQLKQLTVIADAGLLSNENITKLQAGGYEYILGARIKNESTQIKEKILALKLQNGQSAQLVKNEFIKLIISYSDKRAKKDAVNRKRGLEKLKLSIANGKLTKNNINNRGYNKYLKLTGEVTVEIDNSKYKADAQWDGLKGYLTNSSLSKEEIIEQYVYLWKIEKAFRISKTDLKIRPIFHRIRRRIEAHICIAFCSYKIYKELERQLKVLNSDLSPEKAINIANTIYQLTMVTPYSNSSITRILLNNEEQKNLFDLFKLKNRVSP
jgi:transposase